MITVTVLHADGRTTEQEIEPELEAYQKLVGGYIEVVATTRIVGHVLLVNEEGRLRGLPANTTNIGRAFGLVGDAVLVPKEFWR